MPRRGPTTSLLTEDDLHLWNEGTHYRLYEKLGAHPVEGGTHFSVWAPNADSVSVIGDWNDWDPVTDPLSPRGVSGIWEGFIEEAGPASAYKYRITNGRFVGEKADPIAFHTETPPKTASKVWDLTYEWDDARWMSSRSERNAIDAPMAVYEMHVGSWRRHDDGRHLTYVELAEELPGYLVELGFTHVELMPVMEHPFYGSWGYQTTGYYAPTSRYGTPQDFMTLIDALHRSGVGVILDWVPSHFPTDEHGLGLFDGTHLYEHADPRLGFHPDWNTYIYNYGRAEVPAFLISNALFWLDRYHVDGLRVDAVASMLYLDYSRQDGEWIPNVRGGRENLEAIDFLKRLNEIVYQEFPDVQTMAEESTSWPMVSRPTFLGGLGFGLKWDMGWMHDTLVHLSREPVHRNYHHHELTFRAVYAFSENFILPISHDEVVYGKRALLEKFPGDDWQKFATLRLLLAYMYTQPGKKLLFMGAELAQRTEWSHDSQLEWRLADLEPHRGIRLLITDLNRLHAGEPALHQLDCDPVGFEWAVPNDSANSVIAYFRRSGAGDLVLVAVNLTPVPRHAYRIGVPRPGRWAEILNTDAAIYGGSGQGNMGAVDTGPLAVPHHGRSHSIDLTLPPLGVVILKHQQFSRESPERRRQSTAG
ncbi:MAG: 1,4-alpha-glucan branching protein GlgB [Acidimicrobiia bacterium]